MPLSLETLKKTFTGDVIVPGDAAYDSVRSSFIAEGHPAVVFQPLINADVAQAIQYAKENNLTLSIRSGGHSGAGHSTNEGGVVISLKRMSAVEVLDAAAGRVRVGAGAVWGDVAAELKKHGLALSSGDTKTVGVGGLTVGGGIGWLVRKFGLTIDHLVAAEIVTAAGEVLRASKEENTELFWAVRGGGGNFGVVTAFEFMVPKLGQVYAGAISYGVDHVAELLKGWRDAMRSAPDELTTMFLLMPQFGEAPPAAMVLCCYTGDDEAAAQAAIEPLRHLGGQTPKSDAVAKKDYVNVLEDAHPPQGVKIFVRNTFIKDFSNELAQTIAESYKKNSLILQIRSVGGAMNRVPAGETAFAHRDSEALIICPRFVAPTATETEIRTALEPWQAIGAFGSGSYGNFFSEITAENTKAAFPAETYQRLLKVKQQYDPENIFNQNCNIVN